MKNHLKRYFINGILTLVPIGLTLFLGYKTFLFVDGLLGLSIPGLGFVLTLLIVLLTGFLATHWLTNKLIRWVDDIFVKLPLVKSVYGVVKDTISSFVGEKNNFSNVVAFPYGDSRILRIGFLTSEMKEPIVGQGRSFVLVYVPQSFQVSGDLYLVPKEEIIPLQIQPEEAMKLVLSGGMTGTQDKTTSLNA